MRLRKRHVFVFIIIVFGHLPKTFDISVPTGAGVKRLKISE